MIAWPGCARYADMEAYCNIKQLTQQPPTAEEHYILTAPLAHKQAWDVDQVRQSSAQLAQHFYLRCIANVHNLLQASNKADWQRRLSNALLCAQLAKRYSSRCGQPTASMSADSRTTSDRQNVCSHARFAFRAAAAPITAATQTVNAIPVSLTSSAVSIDGSADSADSFIDDESYTPQTDSDDDDQHLVVLCGKEPLDVPYTLATWGEPATINNYKAAATFGV